MTTDLDRVPMSPEEHRDALLRLIDEVHEHCRTHDLTFLLYAGTLIGAVRHEGFIPWDDDIDVMMPRLDYETFCAGFESSRGAYLVRSSGGSDYPYAYAKVCLADTEVRENVHAGAEARFGINVDVIPFDHVPDRVMLWRLQRRVALVARSLLLAKVVDPAQQPRLLTRLGLRTAQAVLRPVSTHLLVTLRDCIAQLATPSGRHVGMLVASVPWRMPEADVLPPATGSFEGRILPVPSGTDALLRAVYGDYWTLPPEKQRVAPHPSKPFWLRPTSPEEGCR